MLTAMTPVVRKIPDPMTLPITNKIADPRPIARISSASRDSWTAAGAITPETVPLTVLEMRTLADQPSQRDADSRGLSRINHLNETRILADSRGSNHLNETINADFADTDRSSAMDLRGRWYRERDA
jgi:hypothetical protein